jgi:hypothetical protein
MTITLDIRPETKEEPNIPSQVNLPARVSVAPKIEIETPKWRK